MTHSKRMDIDSKAQNQEEEGKNGEKVILFHCMVPFNYCLRLDFEPLRLMLYYYYCIFHTLMAHLIIIQYDSLVDWLTFLSSPITFFIVFFLLLFFNLQGAQLHLKVLKVKSVVF